MVRLVKHCFLSPARLAGQHPVHCPHTRGLLDLKFRRFLRGPCHDRYFSRVPAKSAFPPREDLAFFAAVTRTAHTTLLEFSRFTFCPTVREHFSKSYTEREACRGNERRLDSSSCGRRRGLPRFVGRFPLDSSNIPKDYVSLLGMPLGTDPFIVRCIVSLVVRGA